MILFICLFLYQDLGTDISAKKRQWNQLTDFQGKTSKISHSDILQNIGQILYLVILVPNSNWTKETEKQISSAFQLAVSNPTKESCKSCSLCGDFVPVYPDEQIVVVSNGAQKLNLCCCRSGRVLQPDEIWLKFLSTVLQLECSHFSRQHTLYLNCTITLV